MPRKEPFEIGEWYHCYNRGVDKRTTFLDPSYYERFIKLLYVCNDADFPTHLHNQEGSLEEVLQLQRGQQLVQIGAYCLMPNHYHLLLREEFQGGITTFMRKVATGYTMYFNTRNERTGALFGGAFKSKHVVDDRYLKRLVNYIHANSAELVEPEWKTGEIKNESHTYRFLTQYPFSSLPDYLNTPSRYQENLLAKDELLEYYDSPDDISVEKLFSDRLDFLFIEVRP